MSNGNTFKVGVSLPGMSLKPPKFIEYQGRLYQHKGNGLGQEVVNFYHEVKDYFKVK